MKKQLISAVGVIYVHNLQSGTVEPNVLGEVFYMRDAHTQTPSAQGYLLSCRAS